MINTIFKNKIANAHKLLQFDFKKQGETFVYQTKLFNAQFLLTIIISLPDKIESQLLDLELNEPYTLFLNENATGNFVGQIREEYKAVLQAICDNCFERDVFKNLQTRAVIDYIENVHHDKLEFLWEKFDNNAICRRADNRKWYCLFVKIAGNKIGLQTKDLVEILIIRTNRNTDEIINLKNIFPAYHMNKKNWISILLDNSMPNQEIFALIEESHKLAKK